MLAAAGCAARHDYVHFVLVGQVRAHGYLLGYVENINLLFFTVISCMDPNIHMHSQNKGRMTAVISLLITHSHHFHICFHTLFFLLICARAVLSGFFSILPVLSSWLVWVPASLVLYFQGRLTDAFIVAGMIYMYI